MNTANTLATPLHSVARYVPGSPHFKPDAPTLASSLAAFSSAPEFNSALAGLSPKARCLVIGYSTPSNARALRQVLGEHAVTDPSILVIDRLPIPEIYTEMGIEMPEIDFLQLDACNLGDALEADSFDLIVQDFVLNCMPPAHAPALLQSTRALLKPNGLSLISLSTDAKPIAAPAQPVAKAMSRWPDRWSGSVWSVSDLARSPEEYTQMATHFLGRTLIDEETGHLVQVTSPTCQFEYFIPSREMDHLLQQAGFKVIPAHVSHVVDYSGLACTRHRLIAIPA